jgi:hypothetical protein
VVDIVQGTAGLACLLAGVCAVTAAGARQAELDQAELDRRHCADPAGVSSRADMEEPLLLLHQQNPDNVHPEAPASALLCASRAVGVLLAVLAGSLGGLLLLPMDFVGHECRGLPFLPALALGVAVSCPPVTLALHWAVSGKVNQQHQWQSVPQRLCMLWGHSLHVPLPSPPPSLTHTHTLL